MPSSYISGIIATGQVVNNNTLHITLPAVTQITAGGYNRGLLLCIASKENTRAQALDPLWTSSAATMFRPNTVTDTVGGNALVADALADYSFTNDDMTGAGGPVSGIPVNAKAYNLRGCYVYKLNNAIPAGTILTISYSHLDHTLQWLGANVHRIQGWGLFGALRQTSISPYTSDTNPFTQDPAVYVPFPGNKWTGDRLLMMSSCSYQPPNTFRFYGAYGIDTTLPYKLNEAGGLLGAAYDWHYLDADSTEKIYITTSAHKNPAGSSIIDISTGNNLAQCYTFLPPPTTENISLKRIVAAGIQSDQQLPPPVIPEWTLRSSDWDGTFGDPISNWSETLGLFVAATAYETDFLTSSDGITWTPGSFGGSFFANDMLSGRLALNDAGPLFMIGGVDGATVGKKSTDGVTWTTMTGLPFGHGGRSYAYSPSLDMWIAPKSVAAVNVDKLAYSTDDGTTWTSVATPYYGITFRSHGCAWSEPLGLFVVGLEGGPPSPRPVLMTSPDGINWTDRSATVPSNWLDGGEVYGAMWSDAFDCFIAYGGDDPLDESMMTSADGINWSNIANDPLQECFTVIEVGSDIWAAGYNDDDTVSVFRTSDLSTWEDMECPIYEWVTTLSYSPSLQMVVAMGAATGVTEAIATFGPV